MTRALYLLGHRCARHAKMVFGLWLLVLLGVAALHRLLPPPALEPFVLAGTESASAQVLLNSAFPGTAAEAAPLVVHDESLDLSHGRGRELVKKVVAAIEDTDAVSAVDSPLERDDLLSTDRHTAIIQVTMADRASGKAVAGQAVLDNAKAASQAVSPRAVVALGGYLGQQISRTDTRRSEALGLLFAVIVLLFTLRRGWPILIPLLTALMSVGIGLNLINLLGRMVFIPDEAPTLGTMLGLGVGIDYALFLVTRHRRLLRRGYEVQDAIGRTQGTAGAGMVFAGATLLAAVSGLALTGISFLAWLGYSAAIVVAIALAAALTLVPALMSLMGARVLPRIQAQEYLSGQYRDRMHGPADDSHLDRGMWARIANTVTSRPWPFAIGATLVLVVMAAPMLTMKFQQVDSTALPAGTTAHVAQDLIVEAFGPGVTGPLAVVAQLHQIAQPPADYQATLGSGDPRTLDERLTAVTAALSEVPGVQEVTKPVVSTDGGVALWRIVPETGASDPATAALVSHLRREVLPQVTSDRAMVAYVGGVTAARTDLTDRVAQRLRPFILGVVSLSFLLLMVAYRSLVIPAKAALMNLLSICASYGVVVMIFQWGWGGHLIGLDGPVPIESYVPMMMFAILFGLSMDYEVFLLTAFSEHFQRTGDIVTSIRRGLADTGQVITAAALIMVAVFTSFVILDNDVIKMFGVGLATAVFVDATVVRCVLVPSLMVLAAAATWWLPNWLARILPHLHVEGDPTALEDVYRPRPQRPSDSRPGAGWFAVIVGVLVGWWLGINLGPAPASSALGLPVALGASFGALMAWMPRTTSRAGQLQATRYLAFLAGGVMAMLTYTLVGAIEPAAERNPALQAGMCVLLPLAVVAGTGLRHYAIPVWAGVVSMAAALVVTEPTPATMGGPLLAANVATLGALLTTRFAAVIGRERHRLAAPATVGDIDRTMTADQLPAGQLEGTTCNGAAQSNSARAHPVGAQAGGYDRETP